LRVVRILILGGTVFLGRHVAAEALARGHEVSLFTRGIHGAELFPGAEHLRGDRTGDLNALRGGEWDVVVDTSGMAGEDVAASAAVLADRVRHYVFVSSVNAHPDWPEQPVDEGSRTWEDDELDDYGAQKAACERAAEAAMPGRVTVVRAGLLCGPHDPMNRLAYWIGRIAKGGDVLAPGDPERAVQLIDARDLAAWMLDAGERGIGGAFCATAPAGVTPMRAVLEAASAATGSGARLIWVPDDELKAAGIEPWDELPLWIPEADAPGTWRVATNKAEAHGLRCRPVAQTVADTWAWLAAGGDEDAGAPHRARGLDPARELDVLSRFA
jgi:nucleoside-diphosphate-sugar epimerase